MQTKKFALKIALRTTRESRTMLLDPQKSQTCTSFFRKQARTKSMADQIQQGDVLRLEISPKYATIQVVPNGNEGNDANFPRNLHNAAELFLKLGMVPNAVKLKTTTDKLLEMYQGEPKTSVKLGKGCCCWRCGYVGIPKDYDECQTKPGPCNDCQEMDQINWVSIQRPDGTELPWIELSAMTSEQAKAMKVQEEKELAERRAAVEARVAAALKERQEKEEKEEEAAT